VRERKEHCPANIPHRRKGSRRVSSVAKKLKQLHSRPKEKQLRARTEQESNNGDVVTSLKNC